MQLRQKVRLFIQCILLKEKANFVTIEIASKTTAFKSIHYYKKKLYFPYNTILLTPLRHSLTLIKQRHCYVRHGNQEVGGEFKRHINC